MWVIFQLYSDWLIKVFLNLIFPGPLKRFDKKVRVNLETKIRGLSNLRFPNLNRAAKSLQIFKTGGFFGENRSKKMRNAPTLTWPPGPTTFSGFWRGCNSKAVETESKKQTYNRTCDNFFSVSCSDGREYDDMKSGRHFWRHDHAERLQLRVDVLAELPARIPNDVLAHDDPVEVVKRKTVFLVRQI